MSAHPAKVANAIKLAVRTATDFPVIVFFNRFRIDRFEYFVFLHVAAFLPDSMMGETFSFAIEKDSLSRMRPSILEYLDKMPVRSEPQRLSLTTLSAAPRVSTFNVLSCSYSGGGAEIMLNNFPIKAGAEAQRTASSSVVKIDAQGIALLYSQLAVHRNLLFSLVTENADSDT